MGRKLFIGETLLARLLPGTIARMDAILEDGQKRADLLRQLLEEALTRRERLRQRRAVFDVKRHADAPKRQSTHQ